MDQNAGSVDSHIHSAEESYALHMANLVMHAKNSMIMK
jgi:hypothetical protein